MKYETKGSNFIDDFALKKRGRGRPVKSPGELARKYNIRLKKKLAEKFENFKGQTASQKMGNLIEEHAHLQNALDPQIECVETIIKAVRKIFDHMTINPSDFRSKSNQPVLIESRQEADLFTKILEKKKELLTTVRIFMFDDEFLKTKLTKKDFEFYYWFKNRS